MKKKFIIILLLLVTVKAYAQLPGGNFKIKGHISKLETGTIFFSYPYNEKLMIDSSKIVNGNFEFSGKISQPVMAYIRLDNTEIIDRKALYIFLEPTIINVDLNNEPFSTVTVEGSKTHSELMEWKHQDTNLKNKFAGVLNKVLFENEVSKHKILEDSLVLYNDQKILLDYTFIINHPKSYVSPYLLGVYYRNFTVAQLKDIYNNMGSKLQTSVYGKELFKHLHKMVSNTKGDVAANIVSNDYMNNKDFNLKSLKGQYVIIDFWGSWCLPCIKLMPHLVEEHNEYKNKNIVFVSVCRDYNANLNKCKNIVNQLGMNWVNLWDSEDKTDVNGITSIYNVGVYPTFILIDPNGEILERGEGEYGYFKCKAQLEKIFTL
jgi:thiol-disulfide isomerase/thioredoxin